MCYYRMDLSTKSRVLMVVKVPKKLIKWWEMFNYVDQQKLVKILGDLTELLHVTPRPDLIEALLTFWDPSSLVFRFGECEMTPTLAEISGLLHLPYIEKDMIRARNHTGVRFLQSCGLKSKGIRLGCLSDSWVSLDFLFARFGPSEGFDCFWDEFHVTKEKWERKRLEVFTLALLGTLVFPLEERRINTRLQSVVMALFHKDQNDKGINQKGRFTLIPMILTEIYKALTEVKGGRRFFEGSNLILQLWMMEHLHAPSLVRPDVLDRCIPNRVKAMDSRLRLDKFSLPVGVDAWIEFLESRTGDNILWTYLWLRPKIILLGC